MANTKKWKGASNRGRRNSQVEVVDEIDRDGEDVVMDKETDPVDAESVDDDAE